MKFNKPLLITSLVAVLASPALLAGDDTGEGTGNATSGLTGDTQTLTITVPEVSLIDVTDALSATLVAPIEAGDNFNDVSIAGATYDISANIAADGSVATKKIIATPASIPAGWRLDITMAAPTTAGTSTGLQTFTSSNTAQEMVTGITNVAESGRAISISVGPESAAIMPSYDAAGKAVTVVYTITAG
jgi:hypothetical protein